VDLLPGQEDDDEVEGEEESEEASFMKNLSSFIILCKSHETPQQPILV